MLHRPERPQRAQSTPRARHGQDAALQIAARLNGLIRSRSVLVICGLASATGVARLTLEVGERLAELRGGGVTVADGGADLDLTFADGTTPPSLTTLLDGQCPAEPRNAAQGLGLFGPSSRALGPDEVAALYEALRLRGDVTLIAAAGVLELSAAVLLAGSADAVVLAVAAGRDRRDSLAGALELLGQAGATVLGSVLVES